MNLENLSETQFFDTFERSLRALLDGPGQPTLCSVARHLCLTPDAKRARPRLVHELGLAAGIDPTALIDVAVTAELLHSASLLHDDVVDEGTSRRGRPTANVLWGNAPAVLAGDLLYSMALRVLRGHLPCLSDEAVDTVTAMTRSAILEIESRGQVNTDEATWHSIAAGKTGALFEFCARAVAHMAGRPAHADRFGTCARRLGVAFQMVDDLVDLFPGSGKDRFADLRDRNPNLVVILAVDREPSLRAQLEATWPAQGHAMPQSQPQPQPHQIDALGSAVSRSSGVAATHEAIQDEIAAGLAAVANTASRSEQRIFERWATGLLTRAVALSPREHTH